MTSILVVDEDDMVRQLMRQALEARGHQVFTAPNGLRALLLCEERLGSLALLVCAVRLPDMLGSELYSLACESQPTMSVLFLEPASERAPVPGALRKPVRSDDLVAQVERRLRARDA